jgi:hypothetical protein
MVYYGATMLYPVLVESKLIAITSETPLPIPLLRIEPRSNPDEDVAATA